MGFGGGLLPLWVLMLLVFSSSRAFSSTLPCYEVLGERMLHGSSLRFEDLDFRTRQAALESSKKAEFKNHQLRDVRLKSGSFQLGRFLGEGHFGSVYCLDSNCEQIIKFAKNGAAFESFQAEIKNEERIRKAGIRTAKIKNVRDEEPVYLIKEFVSGSSLDALLKEGALHPIQMDGLIDLFVKAFEGEVAIDANNGENFLWVEREQAFLLIDNYLPESLGLGDRVPNLSKWKQLFKRDADRDAFLAGISAILGEEKMKELDRLAGRSSSLFHAVQQDPTFRDLFGHW